MSFDTRALGRFHVQVESVARELADARRLHDFAAEAQQLALPPLRVPDHLR